LAVTAAFRCHSRPEEGERHPGGLRRRENPNVERLRALLLFDRRARNLADALLVNYTGRLAQSQSLERRHWQAAHELAQDFGRAYGQILRQLEHDVLPRTARDFTPLFLLRLFQHRQIEFLLQPFANRQADSGVWARFKRRISTRIRSGFDRSSGDPPHPRDGDGETTIEQEYLHCCWSIMNAGHFSAYDAFWVNQWLPAGYEQLVEIGPSPGEARAASISSSTSIRPKDWCACSQGRCDASFRSDAVARADRRRCLRAARRPAQRRRTANDHGQRPGSGAAEAPLVFSPKPPRINRREGASRSRRRQAVVGLSNIARMSAMNSVARAA
jgi:hypothetical protein